MGTMQGNSPSEVIEYLALRVGEASQHLVAYLKAGEQVKLYTNEQFRTWYCQDKEASFKTLPRAEYDNDLLLERFIKAHFMGLPVPQEELIFCHLGNGVTVCDRLRQEHGDYMTVAHIATNRRVTYYNSISQEGKERIEKFTKRENMSRSTTQPELALAPIK